jgi:cellobiose epimerase
MNDQKDSSLIENAWLSLPGELETELNNILDYWAGFATDYQNGGFFGRIDQENKVHVHAPRGSVLNSRILWSFSAAYNHTQNPLHRELATRAYNYIREYIMDHVHGGLYWSVDAEGSMLDGHKQVYAQAFGIYAMSEYYRATSDLDALKQAFEWYQLIEKNSRDPVHGGYIDAFARDWSFLDDKRLSDKDENASKTMNTHLHVVEAYANLYEVYPDEKLKSRIMDLLAIFDEKIIHKESHHLGLFFSEEWQMDSMVISYGHDMEAGWLLQSCAESIQDTDCLSITKKNALLITDAAMEGMDEDGGLFYEYNSNTGERNSEKHWWPQAEALIGFCNAWQLSRKTVYKNALISNWNFIRKYILDTAGGEWYWGIDGDKKVMPDQDKVGIWKCPYHNSRACLELLKRLKA